MIRPLITLSRGKSHLGERQEFEDLQAFYQYLQQNTYPQGTSKHETLAFIPVGFRPEAAERSIANVATDLTLFVLDYDVDNGLEAAWQLATDLDLECIIYSTPSFNDDTMKVRLVASVAEPLSAQANKAIYKYLQHVYQSPHDVSVNDISRYWFLPHAPVLEYLPGKPLDLLVEAMDWYTQLAANEPDREEFEGVTYELDEDQLELCLELLVQIGAECQGRNLLAFVLGGFLLKFAPAHSEDFRSAMTDGAWAEHARDTDNKWDKWHEERLQGPGWGAMLEQADLHGGAVQELVDLFRILEREDQARQTEATAAAIEAALGGAPVGGEVAKDDYGRVQILVDDRAKLMNDEAIDALAKFDPHTFAQQEVLVYVRGNRVVPHQPETLTEVLSQRVAYQTGKGLIPPPERSVKQILTRKDYPQIQQLLGATDMPVLRPDGSVACTRGYDPASQYYLTRDIELPAFDSVHEAIELLKEPFAEYTFTTELGLYVAIAKILTACGRSAFDGPSPLFVTDARQAGTGKTKLDSVATIIGFGGAPTSEKYPSNDEELGKVINSYLKEGSPYAFFDNAERPIGAGALNSAVTAPQIKGRILGKNETFTMPNRMLWMVNGNDIKMQNDVSRRVLYCPITTDTNKPEHKVFRRPDLEGWVLAHRDELYAAALHVLGSYLQAGRPNPVTLGSFHGWAGLIASALNWATGNNVILSQNDIEQEADLFSANSDRLIRIIHEAGAVDKVSALSPGKILGWAKTAPPDEDGNCPLEELSFICGEEKGEITAQKLGMVLSKLQGVHAASGVIERRKLGGSPLYWAKRKSL